MMNPFKLQWQWYYSIVLIVWISCSLNPTQITSLVITSKESTSVPRMVEAYEKFTIGPLSTERHYYDGERSLGKLDTFDAHMRNFVKDEYRNEFWNWINRVNERYGKRIWTDGIYAERDFYDQFLIWFRERRGPGPIPPDWIDEYRLRYPYSGDMHISIMSYLRHWSTTRCEFISRYLPNNPSYRFRFIEFTKYRFEQYSSYSAIDFFTEYVKFAMHEVHSLRFGRTMSRNEFITSYLPEIDGLRWAFSRHLDGLAGLSKARDSVPTHRLMSAYLQWAAECDVRAFGVPSVDVFLFDDRKLQIARGPLEDKKAYQAYYHRFSESSQTTSDLERLFESRLGDPKLKKDFIRHINEEAERLRSTPEQLYLPGDIHWRYRNYVRDRVNSRFIKRIIDKYRRWKYNTGEGWKRFISRIANRYRRWKYDVSEGWSRFKYNLKHMDQSDKFFLGFICGELGVLLLKLYTI